MIKLRERAQPEADLKLCDPKQGTYFNEESGVCEPCSMNCAKCYALDKCLQCRPDPIYIPDFKVTSGYCVKAVIVTNEVVVGSDQSIEMHPDLLRFNK